MKLYRVFLIVLMTSAFAVVGCGDSGGGNAGNACSGPICRNNDVLRGTCEAEFNDCIDRNVNEEECLLAAEVVCGGV